MSCLTQIQATKKGSITEVKELLEEGEDPNSHKDNKVLIKIYCRGIIEFHV